MHRATSSYRGVHTPQLHMQQSFQASIRATCRIALHVALKANKAFARSQYCLKAGRKREPEPLFKCRSYTSTHGRAGRLRKISWKISYGNRNTVGVSGTREG